MGDGALGEDDRRASRKTPSPARRRLAEEKIQNLAFFDSLTGLPNRRLLLDRLRQSLAQAHREDKLVGLAFLDLDHFKTINDTLGHASGDALLRAVAERLEQCVRKSDTVARLGGDEFVVILPNLEHIDGAAAIAEKILEIFDHPFRLGEREIFSSTSIGLAIYPLDAEDDEELLSRADMAMYRAKERGRNLYQFFAPKMNEEAVRRLALHNELSRALRSMAEAAVIGQADDDTGQAICAFVTCEGGADPPEGFEQELRDHVAQKIGKLARPKRIIWADDLPKTRSGKIMRRLLRSIAKGEAITQDVSTLENPAILEQLAQSN